MYHPSAAAWVGIIVAVLAVLPFIVVGAAVSAFYARDLNLLMLGEERAAQLGLETRRFLWIIPLAAVLAGIVGYFVFDVVRERIDIWLNPWAQSTGNAYQLIQAQIAIAAGGLAGTGPGLGSPLFIPVAVSDFIIPAVSEETGLLGTAAVVLMMMFLVVRGISIAQSAKTTFGRYLAFGIAAYFGLQTFIIASGNLGLLPLTGMTFPFFSYGGSSLVTNLVAVMILLKISSELAPVSYTHLRAHETVLDLVCRLLLEKKNKNIINHHRNKQHLPMQLHQLTT